MTDLVSFVFSVGGITLFVLTAVIWLTARPHSRVARRTALAFAIMYALATVYAFSFAVTRILTFGLRPLMSIDVPASHSAIVVMGSGSYTIQNWGDGEYSTTDATAASRALEAYRLFSVVNPAWILTCGGRVQPDAFAQPTGEAIANLLHQLGVPRSRIVTQATARNTHEEALAVAAMMPKLHVRHIILVTSDFHMRRSLGAFKAVGIDATPAIVREPFPPRSLGDWILPSEFGLGRTNLLAHEVVGIGYYLARGWYKF
jgi:uncharacterized SAM-binding protein YcdF (DUF218 family)